MRFWDTSALVPVMISEAQTAGMRALLHADNDILTADIAVIEVASAIWRRRHDGEWSAATLGGAESNFAELTRHWRTIPSSEETTEAALDLLSRHRLRTLDAIQLATAIAFSGRDRTLPIVTLDNRLTSAARAEGFPTRP